MVMLDELVHKPVRKKAVYSRMLEEIQQAIRSGQLPPKSRILSEPELCERYEISRVPSPHRLQEDVQCGKRQHAGALFPGSSFGRGHSLRHCRPDGMVRNSLPHPSSVLSRRRSPFIGGTSPSDFFNSMLSFRANRVSIF